jgi:hypothetical protein
MTLLESLEPELDTAAITGGNPAHRVLLVANTHGDSFTGWARLAVDFQTRSRYAIQISSACGDICSHRITNEVVSEPNVETGKFRWAFTLWFAVTIDANTLDGFLAAWTPEPENPDSRPHFVPPETWLPALEAQPHPGRITLPYTLPPA